MLVLTTFFTAVLFLVVCAIVGVAIFYTIFWIVSIIPPWAWVIILILASFMTYEAIKC